MRVKSLNLILGVLIAFFTLGCNISIDTSSGSPNLELTAAVQALAIQQTQAAQAAANPPTPVIIVVTATQEAAAAPASTNTAEPAPAPQQPEVVNSTLCWIGPGDKYEVVSSLSKGQFVELLGRGSIKGWFIINNPIYNDPCWVQDFDLKVDPGLDLASLEVIYPPAPPTKTPVPPTATP
jgi:hypothetical protein